ncbi:MAG: shikimate kinase [Parasphingorhabdus sp.]|jgi:shikimate kinase|tara:strand:- start:8277 stop:8792 length:516 start_codon:yes stop_codon:yes gene_type:complete
MSVSSVVLIGMPGAGKSTVGILLAKEMGLDFVDTDISIQVREGKTLQQITDQSGYLTLRDIEEQVLLAEKIIGKVVSTGGSAVYSEAGMTHLAQDSVVVFLDVPLAALEARISNFSSRGIARHPGQSFDDLFAERSVLYHRYANICVDCSTLSIDEVLQKTLRLIAQYPIH